MWKCRSRWDTGLCWWKRGISEEAEWDGIRVEGCRPFTCLFTHFVSCQSLGSVRHHHCVRQVYFFHQSQTIKSVKGRRKKERKRKSCCYSTRISFKKWQPCSQSVPQACPFECVWLCLALFSLSLFLSLLSVYVFFLFFLEESKVMVSAPLLTRWRHRKFWWCLFESGTFFADEVASLCKYMLTPLLRQQQHLFVCFFVQMLERREKSDITLLFGSAVFFPPLSPLMAGLFFRAQALGLDASYVTAIPMH